MNKVIVGGLAMLMLSGGVIALATGYSLMNRSQPVATNVGATSVKYEIPASAKEGFLTQFELLERNGGVVRSEDLKGTVHVVNFFFTSCPHSCWQLNQTVKLLHDEYAEEGVKFVSITCDPKNDTPQKLLEYSLKLTDDDDDWLFLTGHPDYVARVGAEMFQESARDGNHYDRLVLVDKQGNIEGKYHFRDAGKMLLLKSKMKELLANE